MRPLGGAVLFVLVLAGGGANAADLTLTDTHLQFHLQGAEARSPVAWGALFLRRADRFMVGADTWVPSRWASLAAVETETRAWLGQLPRDAAERIASDNAERLAAGGAP